MSDCDLGDCECEGDCCDCCGEDGCCQCDSDSCPECPHCPAWCCYCCTWVCAETAADIYEEQRIERDNQRRRREEEALDQRVADCNALQPLVQSEQPPSATCVIGGGTPSGQVCTSQPKGLDQQQQTLVQPTPYPTATPPGRNNGCPEVAHPAPSAPPISDDQAPSEPPPSYESVVSDPPRSDGIPCNSPDDVKV